MKKEWQSIFEDFDQHLLLGNALYEDLLDITKDEDCSIIILPEHLGDSIWVASFAEAYKAKHGISTLFLACRMSQSELMKAFPGVDGVVALESSEMNSLCDYINVTDHYNEDSIRYGHFPKTLLYKHPHFAFQMEPVPGITILDAALLWLDLPKGSRPSRMHPIDAYIPEEKQDVYKKSVLLFPNAQSVYGKIPDKTFEKIADFYLSRGINVYTNYNEFPYEYVVKGTTPLSSTMTELAAMASCFAQVITVRSGAADLLAHTDANLSVIYDSESVEIQCASDHIRLERNEVLLSNMLDLVDRDHIRNYRFIPGREEDFLNALYAQLRL